MHLLCSWISSGGFGGVGLFVMGCGVFVVKLLVVNARYRMLRMCFQYAGGRGLARCAGLGGVVRLLVEERDVEVGYLF